jgi:hypothetical protein
LRLKQVKRYNTPKYPEKRIIIENPELLRIMPKRWKGSLYACIAASSLFMVSLAGCDKKEITSAHGPESSPSVSSAMESTQKKNNSEQRLTPPVFLFGTGRGSYGCVSVAPPVFLSEEEACSVICEEAKKFGLDLEKEGPKLEDVDIPITSVYPELQEVDGKVDVNLNNVSVKKGSFVLDGYDKDKKIGFEFVSQDDYNAWRDEKNGFNSTVEQYNILKAAEILREGISKKVNDKTIGVFYDPHPEIDYKKLASSIINFEEQKSGKDEAIEDLRQQVKGFLNWLKAQGVI